MKVKKKREARSEFICVASKQTKRKLETGDLFCRHSFSDHSLSGILVVGLQGDRGTTHVARSFFSGQVSLINIFFV